MKNRLKEFYYDHKSSAKKRDIAFLLTFEEWSEIWLNSGKFNERGRKKGQYVMARYGDVGPYSTNNVEIITVDQNLRDNWKNNGQRLKQKISEAHKGRQPWNKGVPHSLETKAKMKEAHVGRKCPWAVAQAIRMGAMNKGRKHSEETRRKVSASHLGSKRSKETKRKMSEARHAFWARKRLEQCQ